MNASAYWSGWDIARKIVLNPQGPGGWVLDGWGGLHPFAPKDQALPPPRANPSYPLIPARDAIVTGASGGQVISGFGQVALLSNSCASAPRWPGWDIARAFAANG